jgi:hypothetical protein
VDRLAVIRRQIAVGQMLKAPISRKAEIDELDERLASQPTTVAARV